ncbi:MAG: ribose-phosphate diphosphokinase [Acidobacteria bacterium]|nr:ribose-phosphate diphosphokinase [Acidobacteriota bacterium]
MELAAKKRLQLYAGRSHPQLATDITAHLGVELGDAKLQTFANGEIKCQLSESVRGSDVFIIQSHCVPINESIMEMLIMIDAASRGSAKRITAVCPYYGYSRQDRKAEGREPISAKLIANMLVTAGANRMVSVDLHSPQIQGFFDKPVDHLVAMPVMLEYLREHGGDDLVIVSPDAGRIKVAERYAQHLQADLAFVYKTRPKGKVSTVEAREVIGDVSGRRCVLIDDMIDTAGTMSAAGDLLKSRGATEVLAMATHGILSGPAIDRLKNSAIERVVITDTVPLPPEKEIDKIEVLSVAKIIAAAIEAVFDDTSVSELFGGENYS